MFQLMLKVTAVMLACVALCGCNDDKNLTFYACYSFDPVQTEKCMDEQGYVFLSSHLCTVSYPKIGPDCYESAWRGLFVRWLRCTRPDNKCGPLATPYLALPK